MSLPKITDTENLVLNMSGGLLPENLTQSEILLLKKEYGENWFEKLGYSEPDYKLPGRTVMTSGTETNINLEDLSTDELLELRKQLNTKLKPEPQNVIAEKAEDGPEIFIRVDSTGPEIKLISTKKGKGSLIATSRGWQTVEGAENISYNLNVVRWDN